MCTAHPPHPQNHSQTCSSGQLTLGLSKALPLSRCRPLYYTNYSCVTHITALLLSSLNTRQAHILMAKSMSCVSHTRSTQSSCSLTEKERAWHGSRPAFPCRLCLGGYFIAESGGVQVPPSLCRCLFLPSENVCL